MHPQDAEEAEGGGRGGWCLEIKELELSLAMMVAVVIGGAGVSRRCAVCSTFARGLLL